jgi:hypothetical protein
MTPTDSERGWRGWQEKTRTITGIDFLPRRAED